MAGLTVSRDDYNKLSEAFRRNIELGMSLLEKRPANGGKGVDTPVFPASVCKEAEELIKENLDKLRTMTINS